LTLAVGNATNGSVEIVGDNVVFTPTLNFNGTASFDYTLSDGNGGTVTETVMIDVAPVNDAPVTDADAATATKDTALVILAADLLDDDTDVDGDTLVLQSVGNATNGDVAIDGSGNVVFTPTTGFTGAATFDYTVSDGQGGTATQEVSVTVAAPPEAITSAAKVQPGEAASWKLTGAGGAEGLTYTLESYAPAKVRWTSLPTEPTPTRHRRNSRVRKASTSGSRTPMVCSPCRPYPSMPDRERGLWSARRSALLRAMSP